MAQDLENVVPLTAGELRQRLQERGLAWTVDPVQARGVDLANVATLETWTLSLGTDWAATSTHGGE